VIVKTIRGTFLKSHIFLGKTTKMGKNTKLPQNIPNDRKIDQVSIKYANIFHCNTLQKFTQNGILV
jgi:hypothetical protein